MEDKTFLDEKGLAEVAKLIKENYLGKDKLETLNELKKFVDSWHDVKVKYVTAKELEDFKTQHPDEDYLGSINDPITFLISEANEEEKKQGMRFGTWDYVFHQPHNEVGGQVDWIREIDSPILLININHNNISNLMDEIENRIRLTLFESNRNFTKIQIILNVSDGMTLWRWCNNNVGYWESPIATLASQYVGLSNRKYDIDIKKLQDELAQVKDTLKKINKE